ncbi:MAG: hypothetical protein IH606_19085 [Burkholderiales bacterium]|nr:hypothetical protein [Burkholderiales bacterium]
MGHALDRKAIAQGVHTGEQAKIPRLLKRDEMQGRFSANCSRRTRSKFSCDQPLCLPLLRTDNPPCSENACTRNGHCSNFKQ